MKRLLIPKAEVSTIAKVYSGPGGAWAVNDDRDVHQVRQTASASLVWEIVDNSSRLRRVTAPK